MNIGPTFETYRRHAVRDLQIRSAIIYSWDVQTAFSSGAMPYGLMIGGFGKSSST